MKIESCKDDPSAQCELYNLTALCDPNGVYYSWAQGSCPDYCWYCRGKRYFLIKIKIITFMNLYFLKLFLNWTKFFISFVHVPSNYHPFVIHC